MKKAWLNWSSGKDSALALYYMRKDKEYEVQKLFTTLSDKYQRVSMHGLRKELLLRQVENTGLPLRIADLSTNTSLNSYNELMLKETQQLKGEGFTHSIFGDIFLEDLREYREVQLSAVGIECVFPLWKKDTSKLIHEFLDLGFKAIVVCTNSKYLDDSFCGRIIDKNFLKELPEKVDPCGENGEFHTFVFDGPIFNMSVEFKLGEKTTRSFPSPDGDWDTEFCYCDLLPK